MSHFRTDPFSVISWTSRLTDCWLLAWRNLTPNVLTSDILKKRKKETKVLFMSALLGLTVAVILYLQIGQVGHCLNANLALHRIVLDAFQCPSSFIFAVILQTRLNILRIRSTQSTSSFASFRFLSCVTLLKLIIFLLKGVNRGMEKRCFIYGRFWLSRRKF